MAEFFIKKLYKSFALANVTNCVWGSFYDFSKISGPSLSQMSEIYSGKHRLSRTNKLTNHLCYKIT